MSRSSRVSPTGFRRLVLAAGVAALALAPARALAERITGTVLDPGAPSQSVQVSVFLNEYSSDEEIQRLSGILAQKGPEGLREALWDLEKGWLRIGSSLGYPIAVARSQATEDGGRRIRLLADRPIEFFEIWTSARSLDYPFAFIEVTVDRQGNGEGQMIPAAKVRMFGKTLDIESFNVQPARLLGVRVR